MPIFDYKCEVCLNELEKIVKTPDNTIQCPKCGNVMTRKIGRGSVVFNGEWAGETIKRETRRVVFK